jgi:hypothetical protein
MTLKTKLTLGLGFLFLVIFTLAAFCSYYVETLGRDADNILKDNYRSLVYARNMISALDDMMTAVTSTTLNPRDTTTASDYPRQLFESGRNAFETNLKAENVNITEIHEQECVDTLNHDYQMYLNLCLQMNKGSAGSPVYLNDFLPSCEKLKQSINAIYDMNMQAVVRKSHLATQASTRFVTSMAVIGSLCILLAFGYFWYFPFYTSRSLSYLSNRMTNLLKSIGVAPDATIKDETFAILHAIDLLENKLGVKHDARDGE